MPSQSFVYQGIVVPATIVIPLVIATSRYSHTNRALRSIFTYLLVAGATNCIAAFYASMHINNLPLLHIYTAIELFLLTRFYQRAFSSPVKRKWAQVTGLVFPVICIINFTCFQNIHTFNSYTRPLEAIILIAFSMLYLSTQTANEALPKWTSQPETWIVIGILLYFSSALFQFTFSNIVSHNASLYTKMLIWNIHASLVMIMYLLFAVGFAKCRN
jgi:hypothetical protein